MHRLVLFIHKQSGMSGERLHEMIRHHFPDIPRERCSGTGTLRERLNRPESKENPVIYVLFADSGERLKQLQGLYEYLEGRRMILILPDNRKTTRSMGLRLLPRFLTYANDSFHDLMAVIGKMTGTSFDKWPGNETTDASRL